MTSRRIEEEYFWFWYGDDGEWKPFDATVMTRIEEARRIRRSSVRVQLGSNWYDLNLNREEQINIRTQYPRPMKKSTAIWLWRDDDGLSWNRYSREDSLKLALAAGSAMESGVYIQRGQTLYYIDLMHRTQTNLLTQRKREVHQGIPGGVSAVRRGNSYVQEDQTQQQQQQLADSEDDVSDHADQRVDENAGGTDGSTIPKSFLCPLSKQLMVHPVSTREGVTYERQYIEQYLQAHNIDPTTKRILRDKNLMENRALRDTIEAWQRPQQSQSPSLPSLVDESKSRNQAVVGDSTIGHPLSTRLPQHEIRFTEDYVRSETLHDTLKVVCLGLSNVSSDVAFRNPTNENIYDWKLRADAGTDLTGIHCNVYDFVGQNIHHATQKLFFSPKALYVLVWDMGLSEPETMKQNSTGDQALERNIYETVQFWVDAIQKRAPGALILPVISLDGGFGTNAKPHPSNNNTHVDDDEIQRRCYFLRGYFEELNSERSQEDHANMIFGPEEDLVLKVISDGLESLKGKILQVANECDHFASLGGPVPSEHSKILKTVDSTRAKNHKIAKLQDIHSSCGESTDDVNAALQWLSNIGEILYYGSGDDAVDCQLGQYVILDPRWVADAIASILRPDVEKAIRKARRRKKNGSNPEEQVEEHYFYPGPVITEDDARLLWEAKFAKNDDTEPFDAVSLRHLFEFLQLLFTQHGIMISVDSRELDDAHLADMMGVLKFDDSSLVIDVPKDSRLFFLPGLLGPGEHAKSLGLYQNAVFSKTTLAQSIQFYSMVSPLLLESICAAALRQIYAAADGNREGGDPVEGQMYVKDVLCWRTLLYFKLGLYIRNSDGELQGSVVDIYAHLVDQSSELCVGAKFMGEAQQCLVVSAKGEQGNDGSVIWQGGYDLVTEAIRRLMEASMGLEYDRQVFCPTCLARRDLRDIRSWSECVIQRALEEGERELKCQDGHREKTRLLMGLSEGIDDTEKLFPSPSDVTAHDLMRGVVMVGLYDENKTSNRIRKVGSGFVVDSARGLIVTAGHTLMKIWGKEDFGRDYDGIEGAKVVIGIIPSKKKSDGYYPPAVFRYFATILEKDPSLSDGECHVDACVLQITSRFENDVDGNGDACSDEISMRINGNSLLLKDQELMALEITEDSHLGEPTRILGFDQPDACRLNRSFGISAGYVCKQFETKTVGGERYRYMPRKKTVLICPTIGGHSGGPCVNQEGKVIGILSCADPTEKTRCYLVPTSEWIHLIPKKSLASLKTSPSILKRAVSLVKKKSSR